MNTSLFIVLAAMNLFGVARDSALCRPKIRLELDDSVYVLREPIRILSTLKNDSSVLLRCGMFRYEQNLILRLSNSVGDTFSYSGMIVCYSTPREQTLGFGEEMSKQGDLVDFYGQHDQGSIMRFLPVGEYTVSAYLYLKAGMLYWSDPVQFKVVEPIGQDCSQHDSLVQARKGCGERNGTKCDLIYDGLIDRFPNSRYSDLVLYESATVLRFRREDDYESMMIRLFNSYNEAMLSEEQLPHFIGYLTGSKRKDEAIRLLQNLERRYPHSRVGRAAKIALDSL